MRVLIALAALVTMPFAVSVSQGRGQGHDAEHCAARSAQHPNKDINKCDPAVPPPAPGPVCTVTPPSTAGTLTINGKVTDAVSFAGLANWCIQLTGPVNATAMTDASGKYSFTGLPDGTYGICEVLPASGWQQTFPTVAYGGVPCPTGLGWEFSLMGWDAFFVDFMNTVAP